MAVRCHRRQTDSSEAREKGPVLRTAWASTLFTARLSGDGTAGLPFLPGSSGEVSTAEPEATVAAAQAAAESSTPQREPRRRSLSASLMRLHEGPMSFWLGTLTRSPGSAPDPEPSLPTFGGSGGGLAPAVPPLFIEGPPPKSEAPRAPVPEGVPAAGETRPLPRDDATGVPTGGPLRERRIGAKEGSAALQSRAGAPSRTRKHSGRAFRQRISSRLP